MVVKLPVVHQVLLFFLFASYLSEKVIREAMLVTIRWSL